MLVFFNDHCDGTVKNAATYSDVQLDSIGRRFFLNLNPFHLILFHLCFGEKIDEQKIAAFFRKNSTLVNIKNKDGDYPIHSAAKQGIAIGLQTDS